MNISMKYFITAVNSHPIFARRYNEFNFLELTHIESPHPFLFVFLFLLFEKHSNVYYHLFLTVDRQSAAASDYVH